MMQKKAPVHSFYDFMWLAFVNRVRDRPVLCQGRELEVYSMSYAHLSPVKSLAKNGSIKSSRATSGTERLCGGSNLLRIVALRS